MIGLLTTSIQDEHKTRLNFRSSIFQPRFSFDIKLLFWISLAEKKKLVLTFHFHSWWYHLYLWKRKVKTKKQKVKGYSCKKQSQIYNTLNTNHFAVLFYMVTVIMKTWSAASEDSYTWILVRTIYNFHKNFFPWKSVNQRWSLGLQEILT